MPVKNRSDESDISPERFARWISNAQTRKKPFPERIVPNVLAIGVEMTGYQEQEPRICAEYTLHVPEVNSRLELDHGDRFSRRLPRSCVLPMRPSFRLDRSRARLGAGLRILVISLESVETWSDPLAIRKTLLTVLADRRYLSITFHKGSRVVGGNPRSRQKQLGGEACIWAWLSRELPPGNRHGGRAWSRIWCLRKVLQRKESAEVGLLISTTSSRSRNANCPSPPGTPPLPGAFFLRRTSLCRSSSSRGAEPEGDRTGRPARLLPTMVPSPLSCKAAAR